MNSGSCQCGEIQYAVEGDLLRTYACCCKDCQKRIGSSFSMGAMKVAHRRFLRGDAYFIN